MPSPTSGSTVAERRREQRVEIKAWVFVSWPGHHESYLCTRDISRRGLFVVSDEAPELGCQVNLELCLNVDFHLASRGRVVRIDEQGSPSGFAVEFTDLDDEQIDQMLELVSAAVATQTPDAPTQ